MVLAVKIGSSNFAIRPYLVKNSVISWILNAAAIFPRSKFLKSFWFNWEIFWYTFWEGITCWGFFSFRSKILDLKLQKNAEKFWFGIFFDFSRLILLLLVQIFLKNYTFPKSISKVLSIHPVSFKNFDLGKMAAGFKIQEIALFLTKYGRIVKLGDPILTTNTIVWNL